MEAIIGKISKADQKIALSSIESLKKNKVLKGSTIKIEINDSGESIAIPRKAFKLLTEVLKNMAAGNSVALVPSNDEISTQVAADILNVSRPHLIKLLESSKIPHHKVGTHRRLKINDVIVYKDEQQKLQRKKLNQLTEQAQALNMGYS